MSIKLKFQTRNIKYENAKMYVQFLYKILGKPIKLGGDKVINSLWKYECLPSSRRTGVFPNDWILAKVSQKYSYKSEDKTLR